MPMPFMPFMPHRRPYTMFAPPCPCTPPGPPPEPHTPRPRTAPWGAVSVADALRGISSHLAELDETLAGMPKVITVNGAPLEPEEGVVALSLVDSAELDGGYLRFKAGDAVLFSVDASPFVKDGMVDDIGVADGNLVIMFNTDSGKRPVSIPLTDIFDADHYYDKAAVDRLLASKEDALTAQQLAAANSGATAAKVATWDGYAGQIARKADLVAGATADHLAALDANGNPTDSGIAKTDVAAAQSVTWSELKSLRDSAGLVPGRLYRITDYAATTNGNMSSQSAGHPFDVIVTADSSDRVNEHARAAQHAGDQYFSGRGLHAWDVWYCLDNDANRFAWASVSGKGVVYRLVDEWGNDLPYDFKGLKFKRDGVAFYTFDAGYRNGARVDVDRSLNGSDGYVTGNVMKPYTVEDNSRYMVVRHLNNNVCFGYAVEKNSWDEDCHGNTLGDRNVSTANCSFNVFGKGSRDNSFGPLFLNNTIGAVVHDCTYVYTGSNPAQDSANPATWCQANTIGPYCAGISMVRACSGNVFDYGCLDITLAQNCKQNSFGAGCSGLSLGTSCLRNMFTHGYRSASPDPVIEVPEGTNRKVFTTADDAAATPGALKKVAVTGAYSDLVGIPSLDDAVTASSANGVKSSGIWSAIWGALSALPTGFSSLYDWCVSQLAGKVPTSRTVNDKALSSNVTLTADDIDYQVPGGAESVQIALGAMDAAIAGKLASTSAAPGWVSGMAYTANALVTYDGVVYRCKANTVSPHTATPNTDTTHWEAKKVSDLFLPLTGGTITGDVVLKWPDSLSGYGTRIVWLDNTNSGAQFRMQGVWDNPDDGMALHLQGGTNNNAYATIIMRTQGGHLAFAALNPTAGNLAALDANGNPTDSGVKPSDKFDATSAAPAFSTSSTYSVGDHVTYNGALYRCTTAVVTAGAWTGDTNWTADTMTDPDAVLDITSQNQLRVVAKDGTLLWAQGYDLASTSSATLACDACNNFTFADGATTQAFTLPTAPSGKVGDFGLDIDNSANTGAATMTLTGLDTTFSAVVPEGESLNDMLAIAAGELARFYITLSTFRVNNLPTWHIVKQIVENGGAAA